MRATVPSIVANPLVDDLQPTRSTSRYSPSASSSDGASMNSSLPDERAAASSVVIPVERDDQRP